MSEDDLYDELYGDLDAPEPEKVSCGHEEVIEDLQQKLLRLIKVNRKLSDEIQTKDTNYSSLMKTARLEINRKNETITTLRREREDLVFRRACNKSDMSRKEVEEMFKKIMEGNKCGCEAPLPIPEPQVRAPIDGAVQIRTECGQNRTFVAGDNNSSVSFIFHEEEPSKVVEKRQQKLQKVVVGFKGTKRKATGDVAAEAKRPRLEQSKSIAVQTTEDSVTLKRREDGPGGSRLRNRSPDEIRRKEHRRDSGFVCKKKASPKCTRRKSPRKLKRNPDRIRNEMTHGRYPGRSRTPENRPPSSRSKSPVPPPERSIRRSSRSKSPVPPPERSIRRSSRSKSPEHRPTRKEESKKAFEGRRRHPSTESRETKDDMATPKSSKKKHKYQSSVPKHRNNDGRKSDRPRRKSGSKSENKNNKENQVLAGRSESTQPTIEKKTATKLQTEDRTKNDCPRKKCDSKTEKEDKENQVIATAIAFAKQFQSPPPSTHRRDMSNCDFSSINGISSILRGDLVPGSHVSPTSGIISTPSDKLVDSRTPMNTPPVSKAAAGTGKFISPEERKYQMKQPKTSYSEAPALQTKAKTPELRRSPRKRPPSTEHKVLTKKELFKSVGLDDSNSCDTFQEHFEGETTKEPFKENAIAVSPPNEKAKKKKEKKKRKITLGKSTLSDCVVKVVHE